MYHMVENTTRLVPLSQTWNYAVHVCSPCMWGTADSRAGGETISHTDQWWARARDEHYEELESIEEYDSQTRGGWIMSTLEQSDKDVPEHETLKLKMSFGQWSNKSVRQGGEHICLVLRRDSGCRRTPIIMSLTLTNVNLKENLTLSQATRVSVPVSSNE